MSRQAVMRNLFSILFLLFCSLTVHAQTTYGALTGTVADTTGAAVAGATVTLTNTATAEKQTQTTGESGLYSFVNLSPGRYTIFVEKTGFKSVSREDVVVLVQQVTRVDVALAVGQVSETVTVTGGTPLLQPETSSMGQVVEQRSANELPLNGRNVFNLVQLAPSIVLQGGAAGTATGQNPFSWGNFQIGGAFANQSAEYLDGQPLNIGYINLPILIPTQDSIQEFKVQTHNLGPEWGKLAGGVMNMSTKSGTNTWHGEAYEYIRNKVLNANTWFANNSGLSRPAFTQNQFGANLGGSIVRDWTFFFFQWESFRLRQGQTFTTTVPTAAARAGDVSALAAASGVQVVDPCAGAATCNAYTPVPFPGNVIPATRINPTAAQLLSLYPAPNGPGTVNNYTVNASTGGNQNQYVFRADQKINDAQHIFGRLSIWNNLNLAVDPLGTGLCVDRCAENYTSKALAFGYNNVINPNVIFNLNVSASRFGYERTPTNAGFDFTTLGWPASFNSQLPSSLRTPPTPCITGVADTITCTQGQSFIVDKDTQYFFAPYFTIVHGRHTYQFGAQYLITLDNYSQTNIASGAFGFTGNYTGLAFADFLLGWANNPANITNHFFGAALIPNFVAGKQKYWGTYINDTWRATGKLTLNLGLRWEYQSPWSERFNRQSFFDPSAINAIATSVTGTSKLGAINLVNTPGVRNSRYNLNQNWTMISPRIGFAYSPDPQTVIRSGYGIFWIPLNTSWATNPLNDPVNSIQTQYKGNNGNSNVPSNTITTPWPNFIQPPGRDPSFAADLLGQSIAGVATPQYNYGYMQQWSFGVQHDFPASIFVELAYAGSKGTHLPQYTQQIDQLSDSLFAQAAQQAAAGQPVTIAQQVPNPYFSVASPGSPLSSPTTSAGQLLRRFPQYSGVQLAGQGSFDSSYNSFQATLQRRFNKGGTLLAAYTWSKLMSNTDTITQWLEVGGVGAVQDWNNLRGERSLSSQDVPQRLIISYVLDLPFGKGRPYLNNLSGVANKFIGGWGVDGVTIFQKGFPVNINASVNRFVGTYGAGLRPNVITGCDKETHGSADDRVRNGLAGGNGWINASCFSQPAPWTFGNEPRVDATLRAQGISNFDFAAFKTTNFGPSERMGIQFRAEFFNIFNHPQFGPPAYSFGSATFGQVTSQVNNPRLIQFAAKFMF
jgi:Carboxypeptidase regulatory-like domain